jgi:hypothetical protein
LEQLSSYKGEQGGSLENRKELNSDQEVEYDQVYPNTPSIDTIVFGIPKGEWYSSVNRTLKDSRYLPTTV